MERFTDLGFTTHEAMMLNDAYDAITKAEMWEYMRLPSTPGKDGFMFCTDIELAHINAAMTYQGHSGASYAWTMRQMEAIAKGGWQEFGNRIRFVRSMRGPRHEEALSKIRTPPACACRAAKGFTTGWCGVAGGGVPGCDH